MLFVYQVDLVNMDTTIKLKDTTVSRLKDVGKMGDSYDTVINRLLDEHDQHESKIKK